MVSHLFGDFLFTAIHHEDKVTVSMQNDSLKHNHIIIYLPCLSSPFPISGELPPMSPLLGKTLESAPTQKDFLTIVIKNIPDKWFLFGANLEIDANVLDAVEIENEKKTKEFFFKVFKIWKDQGIPPPFTWKTVVDVLKSMDLQSLSQHIEDNLELLEQ